MENQMKDNSGSPSVESLVKRGCLFLEDSEWNKADEYFDKALDINPEYAPAYIGKLCVELMVKREDSLGDYNELRHCKKFDKILGEYANFQKAIRFADDDYKKKLNGYDQKIKESFPKTIQARFTDEFINGWIASLEKEIANCDAEIVKADRDANNYQSKANDLQNQKKEYDAQYKEMSDAHSTAKSWSSSAYGTPEWRRTEISLSESMSKMQTAIKMCTDMINEVRGKAENARQNVKEYKDKKAKYEAEKQEIDQFVGISCLDRMDVFYNRVVEAMKKESTEDGYKSLAEQFRSLEGYKDSAELADKCDKLVIKAQYDKLVQEKNKAATEEKYRELSKKFRDMGGYESSAKLADECDKQADECVKQKEREKKARYDALVQEKSNASTEDKYRQLTQDFRGMGNYENAVQLASECDKQMNILKKQREEQERQEQARKAAKEAEDRAENERRSRFEEEQKRRKQLIKRIKGLMLTFVPFIVGMILYFLSMMEESLRTNKWSTANTISLIVFGIIFGVPLLIIHFREWWEKPQTISTIVFWILFIICFVGILYEGLNLKENYFAFFGTLTMGVAFIITCAYPKKKYWD